MLNYSHFGGSIPPHAGDISSSVTVCFSQSPLSLRVSPRVRSLAPLLIIHSLFVICILLIPLCSSVSPLRWLSADGNRLFILRNLLLFLEHLTIYLKSSWSRWGLRLFWENLWWLGNKRRPKMDSSFSVNLRQPAVSFKAEKHPEEGGWFAN